VASDLVGIPRGHARCRRPGFLGHGHASRARAVPAGDRRGHLDVGKIGVPDAILSKPGPLDAEQWVVIKRHPQLGQEILARAPRAARWERLSAWIAGRRIPVEARIIAVADTYDVLVSDRPYRKAHGKEDAIWILREESGTHLWQPAVEALLKSVGGQQKPPTEQQAA